MAGNIADTAVTGINIRSVNDPPTVTSDSAEVVAQYSDPIAPLTIAASDTDTPSATLTASTSWGLAESGNFTSAPALPDGLVLTPGAVPGTWHLSGRPLVSAGTYTIRVTISDGVASAFTDITLRVAKEDATIEYSGDTLKTTVSSQGASTVSVNVAAVLRERADGSLGNRLQESQLQFTVYRLSDLAMASPATSCAGTIGYTGTGVGTTSCAVTLAADSYIVNISLAPNPYYAAPVESQIVIVTQPGTGKSTGGGWLNEPNLGSRSNFGFTVKSLNNNIQGNSLYIYRYTVTPNSIPDPAISGAYLPAGEYNWIVKGNALNGLVQRCSATTPVVCTARFTGKAAITAVNRSTGAAHSLGGNYQFQVDVTDHGEPGSSSILRPDTYAIRVWRASEGTYYQLGAPNSQVPLVGGNIQVRPSMQ